MADEEFGTVKKPEEKDEKIQIVERWFQLLPYCELPELYIMLQALSGAIAEYQVEQCSTIGCVVRRLQEVEKRAGIVAQEDSKTLWDEPEEEEEEGGKEPQPQG